ncbi:MAG: hypothetical protein HZA62_00385 [Rhodocyclales bacterium]|nr:hypothetical protein [Rhodocyclales bacterium]
MNSKRIRQTASALLAGIALVAWAQASLAKQDPKTRLAKAEAMFAERCKKAGEFILIGGAGDDLLFAGARTAGVARGWSATVTVDSETNQLGWQLALASLTAGVTPNTPEQAEALYGGSGNDVAWGAGGNDFIEGGTGRDWLFGEFGADYLDGGIEGDWMVGGGEGDELFGGEGDDDLRGDDNGTSAARHGSDYLDGEDCNDRLWGSGGNDGWFVEPGTKSRRWRDGDSTAVAINDNTWRNAA